jgi:hypothetical protein
MRVDVVTTIVYTFTDAEREHLKEMGVWIFILNHLRDNERIEIEQSEGNLGNP